MRKSTEWLPMINPYMHKYKCQAICRCSSNYTITRFLRSFIGSQQFMIMSSNGNILRVTVPLCDRYADFFLTWPWGIYNAQKIHTGLTTLIGYLTYISQTITHITCAGNSPVTGEFPTKRPVTRCFDVFFDLRPYERLSKQSRFDTLSRSLWRHCNVYNTFLTRRRISNGPRNPIKYCSISSVCVWNT